MEKNPGDINLAEKLIEVGHSQTVVTLTSNIVEENKRKYIDLLIRSRGAIDVSHEEGLRKVEEGGQKVPVLVWKAVWDNQDESSTPPSFTPEKQGNSEAPELSKMPLLLYVQITSGYSMARFRSLSPDTSEELANTLKDLLEKHHPSVAVLVTEELTNDTEDNDAGNTLAWGLGWNHAKTPVRPVFMFPKWKDTNN